MLNIHAITKTNLFNFCVVLCLLSFLGSIYPAMAYAKYLMLGVALFSIISFGINNLFALKSYIYAFVLYIIVSFITLTYTTGFISGVKDILFVMAYIMPIALLLKPELVDERKIFWSYLGFFLITIPYKEVGSFSIIESSTFFEGSESFVFFGWALFFFTKSTQYKSKLRIEFFVSVLMGFVTLKRIALFFFMICVILYFLPQLKRVLSGVGIAFITVFYIIFIYLLTLGNFDYYLLNYIGKSSGEITLGRTNLYAEVFNYLETCYSCMLIGSGVGSSYEYASGFGALGLNVNLHSDILKILFEHGSIALIAFIFLLFSIESHKTRVFAFYIFGLFFSDNVIIYTSVMFFLLIMLVKIDCESSCLNGK